MYSLDFINIGCNRVAGCSHWGRNGLLAYGAGKFVAIMDVENNRLLNTLPGHSGRVNSLRWIPPVSSGMMGLAVLTQKGHPQRLLESENELISVCSGGDIIVWKKQEKVATLDENKGHSVTGVDIIMSATGVLWVVACSSDNTVKVWKRVGSIWSHVSTLDKFKPHMIETVSITLLSLDSETEVPLVAAGSVDTRIHLFTIGEDGKVLSYVHLQGHEDWIRSLAFSVPSGNSGLFLASAGQDKRVRLWKITRNENNSLLNVTSSSESASTLFKRLVEMKEKDSSLDIVQEFSYYQDSRSFKLPHGDSEATFSVLLESVLIGHEDWISQVCWNRPVIENDALVQPMGLFTASMDATAIVWQPDADSGLWLERVRVGKVGGNLLGFFGGDLGADSSIIAHGWSGAFHLWKHDQESDEWNPAVTLSGHLDEVMSVSWDPSQNYILSVSKDQTARIWARWATQEKQVTWHEIARPQVHGYDFMCASFINGVSHRFVSGAEEKILRVFDAPQTFIDSLKNITTVSTSEERERPLSANVPPLGLSNKPVFQKSDGTLEATPDDSDMSSLYSQFDMDQVRDGHLPLVLQQPPFEEQLLQRTLWPEIQKLYGHPNEMVSVTCNHRGTLIASGCKAQVKPAEAAIRIWDTTTWKTKSTIQFHKSTVTQLKFSHNDKYLLSVSKARTMAVMEIIEGEDGEVSVVMVGNILAHSRMLWCCGWSHDDVYFATGSRDSKSPNAKIWSLIDGKITLISQMQFPHPVTVTSFAPSSINGGYIVGFGFENGEISFWHAEQDGDLGKLKWAERLKIQPLYEHPFDILTLNSDSHIETVRDIEWKVVAQNKFEVVTCSTDRSIRVFTIDFE